MEGMVTQLYLQIPGRNLYNQATTKYLQWMCNAEKLLSHELAW
jgi:hypothetical protein